MKAGSYSKLGEILLKAGLVDDESLDLALREQGQTGEKLGMVLQRLGIVTEKEIGRVLAGQAGVSHVSLPDEWIQREAVDCIPREFAEEHILFPISIRGNTLTLAMANPHAVKVIDEAGRISGMYIEVVHASESEITDTQRHYFGSRNLFLGPVGACRSLHRRYSLGADTGLCRGLGCGYLYWMADPGVN